MNFTGFRRKMIFFVNEVDFENGKKCNFVLMSLDFVYFVFLGRGLEAK